MTQRNGRRSRRPLSAEEQERRALSSQSRKLAIQIDEVSAAIAEREYLSAELEAIFADPEQSGNWAQLEISSERYRVLKDEEQSLWDEWERLSLEAEDVERKLAELKAS